LDNIADKIFTLPTKNIKDVPYKSKGNMGNVLTGKKSDTSKGIINFKNIRNEMVKKDRNIPKNNYKNNLEKNNSKSPLFERANSYKIKLTPIATHKTITSNKESITPSDVSDLSCNREITNILPVKQAKVDDRKFSIIDIMASESIIFII
jgi:hypothetical protein